MIQHKKLKDGTQMKAGGETEETNENRKHFKH